MGEKVVEEMKKSRTELVSAMKEANTEIILGSFLINLSKFTNSLNIVKGGRLTIDFEFIVWDKQQPGRNPATKAAVVLLCTSPTIYYYMIRTILIHGVIIRCAVYLYDYNNIHMYSEEKFSLRLYYISLSSLSSVHCTCTCIDFIS